jgi:hypothetical protein
MRKINAETTPNISQRITCKHIRNRRAFPETRRSFSMKNTKLKPLAIAFFASGVWDSIAGVLFLFVIGTGRPISSPPTHPYYSVFLASFFFCFAYIQFAASRNIQRYSLAIGCLVIGRGMYVIQLYGFMIFADGFPPTFWFTGMVDATFVVMYFVFAYRGGLRIRDLFLPATD